MHRLKKRPTLTHLKRPMFNINDCLEKRMVSYGILIVHSTV